jgi:hypothetical protein
LDTPNEITVEAWIKRGAISGNIEEIAARYGGGTDYRNWQFGIETANKLRFWWSEDGTAAGLDSLTAGTIADTFWHHVVATFNNGYVVIYLDGQEVGSKTSTKTVIATTPSPLNIGRASWAAEYFNGLVDEVRIYNYARTAEQIRQDYNRGLSTYFK